MTADGRSDAQAAPPTAAAGGRTAPRRRVLEPGALDTTDRAIINALQEEFPISARPYDEAAAALGISGDELISRLARLLEIGAITRFGPFYDAAAMGGAFCLCAMEVPEDRWDEVVTSVNENPEVAHNYARTHRLNMWFVLATETEQGIAETARRIERQTGLQVLEFPKLEEFYIRLRVPA